MEIRNTYNKLEIRGEIKDGPLLPMLAWQRQGSGRKVVGYTIIITRDDAWIRLMVKPVKADGSFYEGRQAQSTWSKEDNDDPRVKNLVKEIEASIDSTDWDDLFSQRPAVHT